MQFSLEKPLGHRFRSVSSDHLSINSLSPSEEIQPIAVPGIPQLPSKTIFGVTFGLLNLEQAVRAVAARPASAAFAYVATPNAVHVSGVNREDPKFVAGVRGAWLRTCDSQIVRLCAVLFLRTRLPYAPGSDITSTLFDKVIMPEDRISVIGGTEEMARRLRDQFGLQRLVQHIPPHGFIDHPEEVEACLSFARENPSRFVFLVCGAPQSEVLGWHIERDGRSNGTGLCVGASLLFVTGIRRRAPRLLRRCGLEWLYRLLQEPRRMTKRLLCDQLPFLWFAFFYSLHTDRSRG